MTNEMSAQSQNGNDGNVLLCALCTIVIVSFIGASVLINCTRHYNITAKQLKGWKEALYAAEAGGDAGFDEVRKARDPTNLPFIVDGWTTAPSPAPTPGPAWTKTISGFGQGANLSTTVTIDKLTDNTGTIPSTTPYYRIRSVGTARLYGLPRTGLSDKFFAAGPNFVANSASRGDGDSLLRKIDFKYDHFKATYGDGDGTGIALVAVNPPQIARRIELIAGAVTPFGAAVKVTNWFDGPGSAGLIDSFNSNNGPYYFAANKPSDPHYKDSHSGGVAVNSPSFAMHQGPIWGDVSTNGGNVTPSPLIHGVIDNNVPLTVPPLVMPSLPTPQANPVAFNSNMTITPASPGAASAPTTYLVSSWTKSVTFNQSGSAQTYVA